MQGKYHKSILSRFWESKLVFNCMFLAIYCHSRTFDVNDISKFLNTCFTFDFISYLTKTPSISLHQNCTSIFEEATVFWGGHRFFEGATGGLGGHRCPWRKKMSLYIYVYIYNCIFLSMVDTEMSQVLEIALRGRKLHSYCWPNDIGSMFVSKHNRTHTQTCLIALENTRIYIYIYICMH